MTQQQHIQDFVEIYGHESINVLKARIKDGTVSKTTIRCQYVDFIDWSARQGDITDKQRNNWVAPSWMY